MRHNRLVVIRESTDWVVWRGEHPYTRARVTVKQVQPRSPRAEVLRSRLEREYQFLNAFQHKNIIRPTQLGNDGTALAFEDTQGSLAQLLRQEGRLPVDLVANVLLQCLDGLDHLHSQRVGHGAIAPESLLLSPTGGVKLGDFTGYRFDQGAPEPVAELKYQAPELLDGTLGASGPGSDLYCVGYLALELLTGDQFDSLFGLNPADGTGDRKSRLGWHANPKRVLGPLRESLTHVPASLLDVIAGLVQKDPAARTFPSAREAHVAITGYGLMSQRGLPNLQAAQVPEPTAAPSREEAALPLQLKAWINGEVQVFSFPTARQVLVGRSGVCHVRPDRDAVSDKHALFAHRPDGWWLYDLASTGGTMVNRRPVTAQALTHGDIIEFAGHACKVFLDPAAAPGPDAPTKPRVFGSYRLIEQIHEGRNGQLFKADRIDKPDREPVALRILPAAFQLDELQIRRFLRGIPDAARFRHPNLVRLYKGGNVLKDDGRRVWFLAMEYLVGGSLRDRLKGGRALPAADVIKIGLDIAAGVQAIAAEGRIHRSIQPACVLFDDQDRAKLGDFFLLRAEVLDTLNQVTNGAPPVGEHAYQAPETLRPGGIASTTADVYSVAAVLYEAATGRPPFAPGKHLPETIRRILLDPVVSPADVNPAVPRGLSDLLVGCLAKEPGKRLPNAETLAAALRGCH
ncbi:MAG TPA: protein kinase [Gemmataceae bacterium]|nr:protein kinase [Gemmataceae bacterium]